MGFDGALGEHIRLALQLSFLVNDFQRAQQIVAGIIGKGQTVSTVIDKAIPGREIIIKLVKLRLFLSDGAVWNGSIHLKVNEILNTIPQTDHAFYTGFGGGIEIRPHHAAVFPEVHFAVHHGIGVVFYIGVSGDRGVDGFALSQLRQRSLLIGATNILSQHRAAGRTVPSPQWDLRCSPCHERCFPAPVCPAPFQGGRGN